MKNTKQKTTFITIPVNISKILKVNVKFHEKGKVQFNCRWQLILHNIF